jgi:gas vesicle protein
MKFTLSFLLGAIFGAAIALLYAPSTGEQLRADIKTQVDTQYARLQGEWQKGVQEMQSGVDKLSDDLQAMSSQPKKTGKPA